MIDTTIEIEDTSLRFLGNLCEIEKQYFGQKAFAKQQLTYFLNHFDAIRFIRTNKKGNSWFWNSTSRYWKKQVVQAYTNSGHNICLSPQLNSTTTAPRNWSYIQRIRYQNPTQKIEKITLRNQTFTKKLDTGKQANSKNIAATPTTHVFRKPKLIDSFNQNFNYKKAFADPISR